MMTVRLALLLMLLPAMALAGGDSGEDLPLHPSQQPELCAEGPFPRCTPEALASGGFPDHKHAYWWPGWEVKTDAEGQPYGPGAFCTGKTVRDTSTVVMGEGRKQLRNFVSLHNPAYRDCDFLPLLELLDWADHEIPPLLGLTATDTLVVISPDNIDAYRAMTGQQTWRLYQLEADTCVIEPYGTLQARTLDGHGLFMVYVDWLLRETYGDTLPVWLHYGLVEYLSEDGLHLNNYMNQFRAEGPVLFSAPLINVILGGVPDPDPARDREMYRRASYSAYLMVWELVENRGGLEALRDWLALVRGDIVQDTAAEKVYRMTMMDLAKSLDPVKLGEPLGTAVESRQPNKQP